MLPKWMAASGGGAGRGRGRGKLDPNLPLSAWENLSPLSCPVLTRPGPQSRGWGTVTSVDMGC